MPSSLPLLIIMNPVTQADRDQIAQHFEVIFAPTPEQYAQAVAEHAARVDIVMTIGAIGLNAQQIDALPNLKMIYAMGAGYEKIDLAHARLRGVKVANGAGTNDSCVADHAMGLMIAIIRGIPRLDQLTRQGVWRTQLPLPPNVSGKKLGIVGLGGIGEKVATRALAFDMEIGYFNRRPRTGSAHRYFPTLDELAQWCDVLLVAIPGGDSTLHLINADVLAKLGANGYLVNIARGSVVDTAALEHALRTQTIAGAALDVYEGEPQLPAGLADLQNLVLTPHVAGWSPEAMQSMVQKFLDNARRLYAGEPLLTPL
ncbi:MAG: 2-hydroxyacid dehydrogenase [Achromobacter sp.]|uniref:2-hydroxyacid dehydrogenase n=1 Tax=Achromobacter sp. TaxID=134375 RepID=UPI0012BE4E2F|nr:2-hydroxyacid dehydrogenase [Achromobacter sp.]MPS78620.1 2-hydroxyacid dehydrogenase [Achromobacter sp.]